MESPSGKIRLIYKPFVIIATGFILIYTFLNWLLFIKAGIPLKEDIIQFLLPLGLPWIPILIWLRPRIMLLRFKKDNRSFLFYLLAWAAIAIPTLIAQEYMITATGKLTQLDNISQISQHERTKYYSLKSYYIDKQNFAIEKTATVTGKNNNYLNFLIYIAMPILDNESDTLKFENKYWLGEKYSEQINNHLSDEEKEEKYKIFIEESQQEFYDTYFSYFTYFEVIGNTRDHDEYNNALKKSEQKATSGNIIFKAHTEPYEARNGNKLSWFFVSLGIGQLAFLFFLQFPKFQAKKLNDFRNRKLTGNRDLKEMLGFVFIPHSVTSIIIDLNLLIFIIMVFSGLGVVSFQSNDLLNWGANFKPLTTNGQWWRLLTSMFLHGGLMHIVVNMIALIFMGLFLEPVLGAAKYAFVYLTTGILASLTSIWWYDATVSGTMRQLTYGINRWWN